MLTQSGLNKPTDSNPFPVALITGAARRIGACIARLLHESGFNIIVHYNHSKTEALALVEELNKLRTNSAICLTADLNRLTEIESLTTQALAHWHRIDALINNASSFYPTPLEQSTEAQWNDLIGSNLKAPFFLSRSLAPALVKSRGAIINIADIHSDRPLENHTIYCIAKAGNVMLTKSLAKELAPHVRVNGISPGAIMWPEHQEATPEPQKQEILNKIPLSQLGAPQDIAGLILFLLKQAPYITGQIIPVDGGRSLT